MSAVLSQFVSLFQTPLEHPLRRTTYVVAGTITVALATSALMISSGHGQAPTPAPAQRADIATQSGAVVAHRDKSGHVNCAVGTAGSPARRPRQRLERSYGAGGGHDRPHERQRLRERSSASTRPGDGSEAGQRVQRRTGSIVRFQQTHNGLPVIGGQLVVSQDAAGGLIGIDGEASSEHPRSDHRVGERPTRPLRRAKSATASATKVAATCTGRVGAGAVVLRPGAVRQLRRSRRSRPVFQMTVTSPQNPAIDEYVLIDARTGSVALAFSQDVPRRSRRPKALATSTNGGGCRRSTDFTADVLGL